MPISPKAPTFGAGAKIGCVQDVRYADFAGAKIGDAAIAEKDTHRRVLKYEPGLPVATGSNRACS